MNTLPLCNRGKNIRVFICELIGFKFESHPRTYNRSIALDLLYSINLQTCSKFQDSTLPPYVGTSWSLRMKSLRTYTSIFNLRQIYLTNKKVTGKVIFGKPISEGIIEKKRYE